ncbi:MAG TPA: M48 family metalloprotease [Pyrinomonadaceae bacterium]|jgi:Zn-dependent protease with chaperone function
MHIQKRFYSLVCAVLVLLSSSALLSAQQVPPGRDMEKEKVIWAQLEQIAPASLATFKRATEAMDRGDYAEAARLYEEVRVKAPEFDAVNRRAGISLVQANRAAEGLPLLEKAVEVKRSPENLFTLAESLAFPGANKQGTEGDKQRALAFAIEADEMAANASYNDPSYMALVAHLSLNLEKEATFRKATKKLVDEHPGVMYTHYYEAIRAAMDEDWIVAEREIKLAESLGLPTEMVQQFLDSGIHTRATVWQYAFYALYLSIAWIAGLFILFVLGKILSNKTLRSIENSDPNDLAGSQQASLRKFYKALINFAGFYYYISLPVVLGLVVFISGSVIYGFISLGRIPIKLLLIIVVCALATIFQMIRSLFMRQKDEDPGRSLSEQEAPGLWALTREVAQVVGTRPIDEIRVTPGTDLAVYERGSFRERKQDKAQRILILGIGVLNGFTQNSFRAVLAHEYGHFTHRDTAGGDVAIRVNADMINFAHSMIQSGQATWWNIAFQFLRVYHFIFRRISHGATRLQEMMADRVAVFNYGAKAFKEGLSHVIYRSVEFDHLASKEISAAINANRVMQNLYEMPESKGTEEEKTIEADFNKAIHRQTTEDDTHPSPVSRFRLASRIISRNEPPAGGTVWELFANRESLTSEMSILVDTQVRASAFVGQ